MVQDDQIKKILQSHIDLKFDSLKKYFEQYLREEISEPKNDARFAKYYENVIYRIDELLSLIPKEIQPEILLKIKDIKTTKYGNGTHFDASRVNIIFNFSKLLNELEKTEINLNESTDVEIRKIFEKLFKSKNRKETVEKIFQALLEELRISMEREDISKSEISEYIIQIQSLLRFNEKTSYIDIIFNWKFAYNLITNVVKSEFSGVPFLAEIIDAFIKSFEDANSKIINIQTEVANEASFIVKNEISIKNTQKNLYYKRDGYLALA